MLRYIVHISHMSKPVMSSVLRATEWTASVHILTHVQTCDDVGVQSDTENSCSKCYRKDCFGTYFTHVQTCDDVRVQSATEWTAWVHASHMSKPVMTFVFKVLWNGLLRYILHTCPNL